MVEGLPSWASDARAAVGWQGRLVVARVAGVRAVAVVRVDGPEDERRRAMGLLPAADPGLLACMLGDGALSELPPLRPVGFLVRAGSWRSGAADAAALSAFAAGTVVLGRAPSVEDLLDADMSGLGVAVVDDCGVRLIVAPAAHVPPPATPMQRLVAEELYAAVLAGAPASG